MILYIPLKLELVALAKAIGLFEIHDKNEIKNAMVSLMQSQDLSREGVMGISSKNFLTTSRTIKIVDLLNLFINKRFQDVINADGSDLALLMLLTLILLENHKELWKKWHTCMGLSGRSDLTKAISHLKCIVENNVEIERLLNKLLNEPLEETPEDENKIISLYNLCLQNIAKLRRIMKINRKRTSVEQDFHPSFEKVVIKYAHKRKEFSHDLIIPFPPYYKTIWKEEAITVDSVASGKNNKIISLSLTPTRLKNIIGWRYESLFTRGWNWIKKYSKRSLWRIIAIGLFLGGVVLIFKNTAIGTILLTFGSLLLSPLVWEWYSKKHKPQENKG